MERKKVLGLASFTVEVNHVFCVGVVVIKEKYEKSYLKQKERIKSEIEKKVVVQQDKFFLLTSLIPEAFDGKTVLDVGGGAGGLAVQVAKSNCEYITLDISVTALKLAKFLAKSEELTNNIHFILADAQNLPIRVDSINVVILTDVLEHVVKPQNVLIESRNALCAEGCVFVTAPYFFGLETLLMDDVIRLFYALKIKKELPTHLSAYTEGQLREMLASSGFKSMQSQFYSASYLISFFRYFPVSFTYSLQKTIFRKSCLAMYGQVLK